VRVAMVKAGTPVHMLTFSSSLFCSVIKEEEDDEEEDEEEEEEEEEAERMHQAAAASSSNPSPITAHGTQAAPHAGSKLGRTTAGTAQAGATTSGSTGKARGSTGGASSALATFSQAAAGSTMPAAATDTGRLDSVSVASAVQRADSRTSVKVSPSHSMLYKPITPFQLRARLKNMLTGGSKKPAASSAEPASAQGAGTGDLARGNTMQDTREDALKDFDLVSHVTQGLGSAPAAASNTWVYCTVSGPGND
jgi:hypothetical protein